MAPDPRDAHQLLLEALAAVDTAAGPAASDDELVAVLRLCEGAARRLDRILVDATAVLARRGVFAERGYRHPAWALADLLGMERAEARRRVIAAEQVGERVGLDGQVLAPRLPATAERFAAGEVGLRHEVIAALLGSEAAGRLTPEVWAAAEAELAGKAALYTPAQLRDYGRALVDRLDQDGPTPDDDGEDDPGPVPRSELLITRHRDGGGWIKARYDDPAAFAAIATVLDAKAAPLTAEDSRSLPQRQADALAEVCGFVLDHADHLPHSGGRRPQLTVTVRLDDLQNRARAGCFWTSAAP